MTVLLLVKWKRFNAVGIKLDFDKKYINYEAF